MYESAFPFGLLDPHDGQMVLHTVYASFILCGLQLHTCLYCLPFDVKLLRRPGWTTAYAATSRCAFIVSKWLTLAGIILHSAQNHRDAWKKRADQSPCLHVHRPILHHRAGTLRPSATPRWLRDCHSMALLGLTLHFATGESHAKREKPCAHHHPPHLDSLPTAKSWIPGMPPSSCR